MTPGSTFELIIADATRLMPPWFLLRLMSPTQSTLDAKRSLRMSVVYLVSPGRIVLVEVKNLMEIHKREA
jgi:hypothetical protein